MARIQIQWSKHARKGGETGRARDIDGKPIPARMGYLNQAYDVALNLKNFEDVDIEKAAKILRNLGARGLVEACEHELEIRRTQGATRPSAA